MAPVKPKTYLGTAGLAEPVIDFLCGKALMGSQFLQRQKDVGLTVVVGADSYRCPLGEKYDYGLLKRLEPTDLDGMQNH